MNQTTVNPFKIDQFQKYAILRDGFLNSLRMLEQQGIIHSLVIDKEFEGTQNIKKMPCFSSVKYEATKLGEKLPYSATGDFQHLSLVSCKLTGIDNFSISLGVGTTSINYYPAHADSEIGLTVCANYNDQWFNQQYISNFHMLFHHDGVTDAYYKVSHSFVDFQMIIHNVRQLQIEKAE